MTEMLGKFSLHAESQSGTATFEAMDRSRIRELAVRWGAMGGTFQLAGAVWIDRAISACANLDALTMHAGGSWAMNAPRWTAEVRHLRRLRLCRSSRWSMEALRRTVELLPLVALVVHCGLDVADGGGWSDDVDRPHATMRSIVLGSDVGSDYVVRCVLKSALGPQTRTVVLVKHTTLEMLELIDAASSKLRTLVIRFDSAQFHALPFIQELARVLHRQPIATVGALFDPAPAHVVIDAMAGVLAPTGRLVVWAPVVPKRVLESPPSPSVADLLKRAADGVGAAQQLTLVARPARVSGPTVDAAAMATLEASGRLVGRADIVPDLATLVRSIVADEDFGPRPPIA